MNECDCYGVRRYNYLAALPRSGFDPVILGTSVVIFRTTLSLIEATNPQTLSLVMVVWWCGGVVVVV